MKQKQKTTERDEQLQMIVYLIWFNKKFPKWKYYKPAGWILKMFSYEAIIDELWTIDFEPLIKGSGFNGLYAFLRPRLVMAEIKFREKKAELDKKKHSVPHEKRESTQANIYFKNIIEEHNQLTTKRVFLKGHNRRIAEARIIEIKKILERYGYEMA